jgi:GNAT superfamily N-acetyltransferase
MNAAAVAPIEPFLAESDADVEDCFAAFHALRPQLQRAQFLPQIRRQQLQSYRILALRADGQVVSVAGFRYGEFLAWGKVLYVDDLSTLPEARGRGFGSRLLRWLIEHARARGCAALHLDSGYARHDAHRLYLRHGLRLSSHHLALQL